MLISTTKRSRFGDVMNQIHAHCLQVWEKSCVMKYNDRNKTSFFRIIQAFSRNKVSPYLSKIASQHMKGNGNIS